MNKKKLFKDGWEFAKSGLEAADHAASTFEPVDLPHDWLIYNTLNLYENSIGWYRKRFTYTKEAEQVLLCFDGVYMDSSVYVNGQFAGEWKYGYSSFEHEITGAIVEGENEIIVKVVYQSPNSRWYSGAGIYRNVWLKTRGRNHIVTDGMYITTKREKDGWRVKVDTDLNLYEDAQISHTILYKGQMIAASSERVAAGSDPGYHHQQQLLVTNPLLWSMDEPHLYQLVTRLQLAAADQVSETLTHNIGFREIVLDSNEGFQLNGKKMKLNGVCEHHDLGALGSAFNKTALRRRFVILKDMGVNAIRTAH